MNRLKLLWQLHLLDKKAFRRSPAFEQSIVAKVLMLFSASFMIIYLIVFGVMFSMIANEDDVPAFILVILPFFLCIDFLMRFMFQQTPLMQAKPYFLLPIPRRSVIDFFLLSSSLSGWNAVWLALFIPYLIIIVAGGATFVSAFLVLLGGMLLVLANSQWYLLIRTLIGRSLLWWILPLVVYASYFAPLFLSKNYSGLDVVFDFIGEYGGSFPATLLCAMLFVGLFFLNRSMQFRLVYDEVAQAKKEENSIKTVSSLSSLEHFGLSGEYLKLEIKSIMRNKAIRARVLMSLSLVIVLSLLITFTDIYDGQKMLNFWCYYCFGIYGMTSLVKIMGPEGNYIDMLMIHRKNIFLLLKSKYYFHCVILVVPFFIMLPAVFGGKFSLLMMFAYMFLTSGLLYFVMFQLAVYNKQTLPLDQKITGKNNVENGLQIILEMVGMFLPLLLVSSLLLIFDESVAYLLMIAVGLVFTFTHPYWLHNVYCRMMARKYENLEGFHASR